MRAFALIALTVIAFIGTIGVPFYTHTCLHDDVSIATVFVTSDHCETEHEEQIGHHDDCCAPENTVIAEDGCCKDNLSLLALSFNYFEHWQLQVTDMPQLPCIQPVRFYEPVFPATDESLLLAANSDPPAPDGRTILTKNCILRL